MIKYNIFILFIIIYIKICLCIRISQNTKYLASTITLHRQLSKQWLLINKFDSSTEKIIKDNLLLKLKDLKLDKIKYKTSIKKLDKIAHKIKNHIFKDRKKFNLYNDNLVKDIKDSSFLIELFNLFKKDPLVYSIWNFKPNILSNKADIIIELHYKFPIEIRGITKFEFNPVVTYKFSISEGIS